MTRWLREPLVHFLVLGTAVFAAYSQLQDPKPGTRLTKADAPMARLRSDWRERTGSAPTEAEEQRLKEQWLEEEALVRRALELGLDQNDTVIRRRLAQRMRFLIEDTAPVPEPDELQLRAWVAAHPERYGAPPRTSFEQIFFSRAKRGGNLDRDANDAARNLKANPESTVESDPFPRGRLFERYDKDAIVKAFGLNFSEMLDELPVGEWQGPIESSYGLHLVKVTLRAPASPPSLEAVRERARNDWIYEQRKRLNRDAIEAIIRRYDHEGRQ